MLRNIVDKDYPNNIKTIKKTDFNNKENELIKLSELDKYPLEAWTALGTNHQLAYSTHGIFRYFGKFPAPIATHLIETFTEPEDKIADVMLGSGTTGLECLISNRNCMLYDVSDLSILLAKVKTTYIEKEKLNKELLLIKEKYKPLTYEEYNFEPIGLRDYNHWFLKETVDGLRGLRKIIFEIDDKDIKNFYIIMFLSVVRRASKATTQQGRMFLDVETALEDPMEQFLKRSKKGIEVVSKLPNKNIVKVEKHNALEEYDKKEYDKYDLVILHPPYFNSYKYSSINSLELSWLGINHADVRKKEVREFFKRGKSEKVTEYVEDMYNVVCNSLNLLKKDGVLSLMIGDTIIRGEYIQTIKLLLDKLEKENKCKVEKVILRIPKYTEASWVSSQRRKKAGLSIVLYDYIIILRRIN